MNLGLVVWLLVLSTPARPEATLRVCPDSANYFEFQIVGAGGQTASWIADTALAVHPTPRVSNPANLVQFVVDSAGIPVAETFRALKVGDAAIVTEARRSLARWRFKPAVRQGCNVRQLVQTPVGR